MLDKKKGKPLKKQINSVAQLSETIRRFVNAPYHLLDSFQVDFIFHKNAYADDTK